MCATPGMERSTRTRFCTLAHRMCACVRVCVLREGRDPNEQIVLVR